MFLWAVDSSDGQGKPLAAEDLQGVAVEGSWANEVVADSAAGAAVATAAGSSGTCRVHWHWCWAEVTGPTSDHPECYPLIAGSWVSERDFAIDMMDHRWKRQKGLLGIEYVDSSVTTGYSARQEYVEQVGWDVGKVQVQGMFLASGLVDSPLDYQSEDARCSQKVLVQRDSAQEEVRNDAMTRIPACSPMVFGYCSHWVRVVHDRSY